MGKRHIARVLAFQAIYSYNFNNDLDKILKIDWVEKKVDDVSIFAKSIIMGTIENLTVINDIIKLYSVNRSFDRISKVDLSILQISIYQIYFGICEGNPDKVIIDEAITICKEYSTDDSYKYINGILDKVIKDKK